jgi:hypothetical protein
MVPTHFLMDCPSLGLYPGHISSKNKTAHNIFLKTVEKDTGKLLLKRTAP